MEQKHIINNWQLATLLWLDGSDGGGGGPGEEKRWWLIIIVAVVSQVSVYVSQEVISRADLTRSLTQTITTFTTRREMNVNRGIRAAATPSEWADTEQGEWNGLHCD